MYPVAELQGDDCAVHGRALLSAGRAGCRGPGGPAGPRLRHGQPQGGSRPASLRCRLQVVKSYNNHHHTHLHLLRYSNFLELLPNLQSLNNK